MVSENTLHEVSQQHDQRIHELYRDAKEMLEMFRNGPGSAVEQYMADNSHVLDLAAGTGVYSLFLSEKYPSSTFVCMEPDASAREVAKRLIDESGRTLTVVEGTSAHIPFDDESFDYIVIRKALQYFVPVKQCIGEIHRVLKPGGMCFILKHINFPAYPLFHLVRFGDFNFLTKRGNYRYLKLWISSRRAAKLMRDASFSAVSIVPTDFFGRDISHLNNPFIQRILAPYAVKPLIIAKK